MTIRLTKEDYKLILTMLNESIISIVLKKTCAIKIPKNYEISKYADLINKLIFYGEQQNITTDEFEEIFQDNKIYELAENLQSKTITSENIMKTFIKEMYNDEEIGNLISQAIRDEYLNKEK